MNKCVIAVFACALLALCLARPENAPAPPAADETQAVHYGGLNDPPPSDTGDLQADSTFYKHAYPYHGGYYGGHYGFGWPYKSISFGVYPGYHYPHNHYNRPYHYRY